MSKIIIIQLIQIFLTFKLNNDQLRFAQTDSTFESNEKEQQAIQTIEDATDQEVNPHDCQFQNESTLPKAITICMRDTFLKRDIDHLSLEVMKAMQVTETTILKAYDGFADLGPWELKVDKPAEQLKQEMSVPNVTIKNDNQPGAKDLESDIQEKVFQMEDIDPDNYINTCTKLETEGKTCPKNSDGTFQVPKFQLNLVLKIKRKHLLFTGVKFKSTFDTDAANHQEVENDIDYQMPQFIIKKGINVFWDKEKAKMTSSCQDPIVTSYIDEEHIKRNFKLTSKSNMARIENQHIIDFRIPIVKQNFSKLVKKQEAFFNGFKCEVMGKQEGLMKNLADHLKTAELIVEFKDTDQLTNLDASYATNWLDIKLSVKNEAVAEPAAYESDLCKDSAMDQPTSIRQPDNIQCGIEKEAAAAAPAQ